MIFCMGNMQSEREREGNERKKKEILGQTTLNHHTHIIQVGRER